MVLFKTNLKKSLSFSISWMEKLELVIEFSMMFSLELLSEKDKLWMTLQSSTIKFLSFCINQLQKSLKVWDLEEKYLENLLRINFGEELWSYNLKYTSKRSRNHSWITEKKCLKCLTTGLIMLIWVLLELVLKLKTNKVKF